MSLIFDPACNPSFFDFKGYVTADQSPPTNFASKNAFVSCLKADVIVANSIISGGGLAITGAINIGAGLGIIPAKPDDVSGPDIVHKSLLFVSPVEGADGASVITVSAPTVVVGPVAAVTDDAVVCWDGTSGRLVKEGPVLCTDIIAGPTPAAVTDDRVVCWDGTSGRLVKEGPVLCTDIVAGPSPASSTDNAVVLWDGATGRLIKDSTLIGNSPTVGGLTLVGDFQVPGTYTALTYTDIVAAIPSGDPSLAPAPVINIVQRFGNIGYVQYEVEITVALAIGSATPVCTVPATHIPLGIGHSVNWGLRSVGPPQQTAIDPTASMLFHGGADALTPGLMNFVKSTVSPFATVAGQFLSMQCIYWIQ